MNWNEKILNSIAMGLMVNKGHISLAQLRREHRPAPSAARQTTTAAASVDTERRSAMTAQPCA